MIVWSGYGILVILIVIVCEFAAGMIGAGLSSNPDFVSMHGWVLGLGLLAAAAACWYVGNRLNSGGRVLVDPQTGQQVVFRRRHSLFFIPIRWWAIPLTLAAIGISFMEKTREQVQQDKAEAALKAQTRGR